MAIVYRVQHAEKEPEPGDPGLTPNGRAQAARAARRLREVGLTAVVSSPLRRARETAAAIGSVTGLEPSLDERLRERLNWAGEDDFAQEWERTVRDRDYVPPTGDSSHQAAQRLLAFVTGCTATTAAVTHGGVTVDLLRTLLGDAAVAPLLADGVAPGAITTVDGSTVLSLPDTAHLQ